MASVLAGGLGLGVNPVGADVINGSFETGFLGWRQTDAGGSLDVVTSRFGVNFATTETTYSPVDGSYFAVLVAGAQDEFVRIEQDVAMEVGDILSGWAYFSSNEDGKGGFNDVASVEVFDMAGAFVARPYFRDSATVGGFVDEDWMEWSFTATAADTYTLRLGVANVPDNTFPSEAGFDDIRLQRVPEPSAVLTLFLGLLVSGMRRRAQG